MPEVGAVFEPPKPIVETPKVAPEPPKPAPLPPPIAEPPVAAAAPVPRPEVRPEPKPQPTPAAPPEARDITELLRDFHIPDDNDDSQPEVSLQAPPATRRSGSGKGRLLGIVAAAAVVLAGGGFYAFHAFHNAPPPVQMGSLSVQTNPPGAAVFVDGIAHGNTPARVSLKAGAHILELRGRGVPRSIPVTVTAGAELSQYLELPQTPTVGSLLVQSEPAGAEVFVDGTDRGKAPANVTDLQPGEHDVELRSAGGTPVHQRVVIEAGVTASVLAPVSTAAPGPVSGWISMKAPVTIEVRENGKLLGTSDTDRIMLSAGRHDIELTNDTLGYHATRAVVVPPGKVAPLTVELPQGRSVGGSLHRRPPRRRNADRQPCRGDRTPRSGLPPSAAGREAPGGIGHAERARSRQCGHEVGAGPWPSPHDD
jgi:hypothetical protein